MRGVLASVVASVCVVSACTRDADRTPALAPVSAAAPAASVGTVPHGDHNPRHGGVVLMNGDEHFEVVLRRDGSLELFFSDAVRNELPAATASSVTVTISQHGQEADPVTLHIDDSGEKWAGTSRPIADPAATARVAYTAHGKPYFIDVPVPR
jgi:hypothetical protein